MGNGKYCCFWKIVLFWKIKICHNADIESVRIITRLVLEGKSVSHVLKYWLGRATQVSRYLRLGEIKDNRVSSH